MFNYVFDLMLYLDFVNVCDWIFDVFGVECVYFGDGVNLFV